MTLLPTRIPGGDTRPARPDRLVIVDDPDLGSVAVRWQLGFTPVWRCKACGPINTADCAHTFSAGVHLAEELLGLSPTIPVPERTP